MDRLHAFCYFLEGLLPRAGDSRCAAALRDGIGRCAWHLRDIAPEFERSDVYAQLLRVRLYADWLGVVPLDRSAAEFEAAQLAAFQADDSDPRDPRMNGGYWFGRKNGRAPAVHQSGLGRLRLPGPGIVGDQPCRRRPGAPPPADLTLNPKIKIAFASGTEDLNRRLIEHLRALYPELPLWVVSDFPPEDPALQWIRYRVNRPFAENLRRCREELRGHEIRLAGVMLVPNVPFRRMRLLALVLSPRGFLAFNENLNHFMLRPGSVPAIARHIAWRAANTLRWSRARRPQDGLVPARRLRRRDAGGNVGQPIRLPPARAGAGARSQTLAGRTCSLASPSSSHRVPARNCSKPNSPASSRRRPARSSSSITAAPTTPPHGSPPPTRKSKWSTPPRRSPSRAPSTAASRAPAARTSACSTTTCCSSPASSPRCERAFQQVPDLFCATAQIRFPPGVRREETGKTVFAQSAPTDFPVRCDEPLPGEDGSYVLYGSGGCSLYDTAKLRALGNVDEVYEPAYVEDLDLGYRAWQRGWPSVYVAGAVVEHRHRATTTRYYTEEQLARHPGDQLSALRGARRQRRQESSAGSGRRRSAACSCCKSPLARAAGIAFAAGLARPPSTPRTLFLALTDGSVSVFPGRPATGKPRVLVASPYLPFPLSHGGAVRMYNLMRRAAEEFDLVLVAFTEHAAPPPAEMLADLRRSRAGAPRRQPRPAASPDVPKSSRSSPPRPFRAALQQTVRKWHPAIAQLEFTQLAQYAADCAPARTILVEHDVTFDLYQQLLASR